MISYTKGCYVGQEIIARIHFRGHVAKQLTGVVAADKSDLTPGVEITTKDGKNAGRVTSVTVSPKLQKTVGLAYVRYDHLANGTELLAGTTEVEVADLPFVRGDVFREGDINEVVSISRNYSLCFDLFYNGLQSDIGSAGIVVGRCTDR